jgi:ATP-binding cassette, subfamily B (MDR/TAP), member 1
MRRKDNSSSKNLPMTATVGEDAEKEDGVKLEFHNVFFRYPTRDAPVLNGLNLTVGHFTIPTERALC